MMVRKNDLPGELTAGRSPATLHAMKYRVAGCLLVLVTFASFAQTEHWEFRISPRIWGTTIAGRYFITPPTVEATETSITWLLSTAFETSGYYRAPDGSWFAAPEHGPASAITYTRVDLVWQLGLQQGLLPRTDGTADKLVTYLIYQGQLNHPFQDDDAAFFMSGRPEVEGSLRGSIIGGLAYSDIVTDQVTRLRQGLLAEATFEWAPPFLHNQVLSGANYTRTTISARGYVPLYQAPPQDDRNRFSAYLGTYAAVDFASGPQIPLAIRQSVGGRGMRYAPGGAVRGYGPGRFDSTLKVIGNVDARMNLPAIIIPQIVPGFVVYTDAAYFADTELTSPVDAQNSGFLVSSGAGFFLDLFSAFELIFYTNYLWTKSDVEGRQWVPFTIGFGFHF
jgi:hypothetical protein